MTVTRHLITIEVIYYQILRCDVFKDIFGISFIYFHQQDILKEIALKITVVDDQSRDALDLIRSLKIVGDPLALFFDHTVDHLGRRGLAVRTGYGDDIFRKFDPA